MWNVQGRGCGWVLTEGLSGRNPHTAGAFRSQLQPPPEHRRSTSKQTSKIASKVASKVASEHAQHVVD
jgi:hypothetical protein